MGYIEEKKILWLAEAQRFVDKHNEHRQRSGLPNISFVSGDGHQVFEGINRLSEVTRDCIPSFSSQREADCFIASMRGQLALVYAGQRLLLTEFGTRKDSTYRRRVKPLTELRTDISIQLHHAGKQASLLMLKKSNR